MKHDKFALTPDGLLKMSLKIDTTPKVYSSYFGNAAKLKKAGIVLVGIARFAPRFVSDVKLFKSLAPTPAMLAGYKNGTMSSEEFSVLYDDILANHHPASTYNDLLALGEGKSVAILCYEKPPDTCHRHSVTDWFRNNGIEVKEYPFT